MDQTLAAIHVMTKYSYLQPQASIALMDKNSVMLLLKPGYNTIELSWQLVAKKGCGFFPSSHKVEKVRTEGLKWNMGNSDQEFSSLDWK